MSAESVHENRRDKRGEKKRLKILRALDELGGRASTSAIDDKVGIGNNNVRNHCTVLEEDRDPAQVVLDGKERIDSPTLNDRNIYRLTVHGKQVVDAMDDEQLTVAEAETFVELRTELVSVKNDLEELQQSHNQLVRALQSDSVDDLDA